METQELDKPETEIEDLTVSEDTAAEVKGSYAGTLGEVSFTSFNFMKKCEKT
jgi:dTDP-4-amino-4,6-dideoxygalactose transaminase